jgi:hypothetical protein
MTTATRKKNDARNADRRFARADNKISARIRRMAAEYMAADPTLDLGQAMKRAIMTVAAEAR